MELLGLERIETAAAALGIRSTVFMPVRASLPKLVATKAYGAEVRQVGAPPAAIWLCA